MKGCRIGSFLVVFFAALFVVTLIAGAVSAQERGIPTDRIKQAYKMLLTEADKNGDGKLSVDECMALFKDKKKGEKDCKYWDANGDGIITEDEYVQQVKNIGKKKK